MAFTKIRETIAAFKTSPSLRPNVYDADDVPRLITPSPRPSTEAVRLGVWVAVFLPSSYAISAVLHQMTHLTDEAFGGLNLTIGVILGIAISRLHNRLVQLIPFAKLNPFFGHKIDETIQAFHHPTGIQ